MKWNPFGQKFPKEGDFMEAPRFNPTKTYLTDLYELVYFPTIPIEKFDAKHIDAESVEFVPSAKAALYNTAVSALNNAHYQLYQVRAVKKYFGEEFLHGFCCEYNSAQQSLDFKNLDDTPEAYQYTREMTRILEKIMQAFLDKYDYYILYMGQQEAISFVPADFLKKNHSRLKKLGRIAWFK